LRKLQPLKKWCIGIISSFFNSKHFHLESMNTASVIGHLLNNANAHLLLSQFVDVRTQKPLNQVESVATNP